MAELDQEKMEDFGGRMMDILNGGMLSLMTSIGHQTGLFEAMAGMPQATSHDVATAAGLDERYVREWLDTMVTGKILEYSPEERAYTLPAEHKKRGEWGLSRGSSVAPCPGKLMSLSTPA